MNCAENTYVPNGLIAYVRVFFRFADDVKACAEDVSVFCPDSVDVYNTVVPQTNM